MLTDIFYILACTVSVHHYANIAIATGHWPLTNFGMTLNFVSLIRKSLALWQFMLIFY